MGLIRVSAPNAGEIEVSWRHPRLPRGWVVAGYQVQYIEQTARPTSWTSSDQETAPADATQRTITGLNTGGVHWVRVGLRYFAGAGASQGVPATIWSDPASVRVDPTSYDHPSLRPVSVQVSSDASSGDVTVSWADNPDFPDDFVLNGYALDIKTTQRDGTVTPSDKPMRTLAQVPLSSGRRSWVVAGLTRGLKHCFEVVTVFADNAKTPKVDRSPAAPVCEVPPADPLPGPPRGVGGTPTSSTTMDVFWTEPLNPGDGAIDYYRAEMRKGKLVLGLGGPDTNVWTYPTPWGSGTTRKTPTVSAGTTVRSLGFTGLTKGTRYQVRVRAHSSGADGGLGPWAYKVKPIQAGDPALDSTDPANAGYVTTLDEIPAGAPRLLVLGRGRTRLMALWEPGDTGTHPTTDWEFSHRKQGSTLWEHPTAVVPVSSVERTAFGVDVSRHQGRIDWAAMSASGVRFAWVKATDGQSWVDPQFIANIRGATAAGIAVGPYHFMKVAGNSGAVSAKHFADTIAPHRSLFALPPALDWEVSYNAELAEITAAERLVWWKAFKSAVPDVIVYTGAYSHFPPNEHGVDLWFAHWHTSRAPLGAGLGTVRAWQFTAEFPRTRLDNLGGGGGAGTSVMDGDIITDPSWYEATTGHSADQLRYAPSEGWTRMQHMRSG